MNDSKEISENSIAWCGTIPSSLVIERAKQIALLLFDVDGVLTDGSVYFLPEGESHIFETKGFDSHDGLGFHLLHSAGIKTGVISGRQSRAVAERAKNMQAVFIYQGFLQKEAILEEILTQAALEQSQIAYVGDDLTDIPLLKRVGLACVVADGRAEAKQFAHFITQAKGGRGAAREVIELLLKSQGKWAQAIAPYGV